MGFQGAKPLVHFRLFARRRGIGKRTNSVEGRSDQRDGARATGATLGAHYRFVVWLVPTVERFLRSQKILLGDRIQATAMDVWSNSSNPPSRGHHLLRNRSSLKHDIQN